MSPKRPVHPEINFVYTSVHQCTLWRPFKAQKLKTKVRKYFVKVKKYNFNKNGYLQPLLDIF